MLKKVEEIQFDLLEGIAIVLRWTSLAIAGVAFGCQSIPEQNPSEVMQERKFSAVSAGTFGTCGIDIDDRVHCWGNQVTGNVPSGRFRAVTAGPRHLCALAFDGTVSCWAYGEGWSIADVPGNYVEISLGYSMYGITTDGEVKRHLGAQGMRTVEREPESGSYSNLSAGGAQFACWITPIKQQVKCDAPSSIIDPPNDRFRSLSCAWHYCCGVDKKQKISCWGSDLFEARVLSTPEGNNFVSVTTGREHACGLTEDGTGICWGEDKNELLDVPHGNFSQISAGDFHTCAIDFSNVVHCWGIRDLYVEP